jgi:hypothetical protein
MNDAPAKRRAPDPATRRPRSKKTIEIVEAKGVDANRYPWTRAFRGSKIPMNAKAVGLVVASYGNADGSSNHPGLTRLAHDLGVDEKTARRHLESLERSGWMRRTHDGRAGLSRKTADDYQLTIPQALAHTDSSGGDAAEEPPDWLDEEPETEGDYWTKLSTGPAGDHWTIYDRPLDKIVQTPRTTPTKENQVVTSRCGVAPATPHGSHSDQEGITAGAATDPRGDRSGEESGKTRGEPVRPERRAQCDDYIAILKHLDEDDVFDVIEELWDSKWRMWIWAYNVMAKAHGIPKVTRDDYEYREPDTPAQALMVYEKALRLSSKNVDWETVLTEPLDRLKFKNRQQPSAWAA